MTPDRRRPEASVAEAVVPVAVGVDDDASGQGSQTAQVGEQLVGLLVGGSRVDDEGTLLTEDDADVLIEHGVAADEHAIADFDPAGGANGGHDPQCSPSRVYHPADDVTD